MKNFRVLWVLIEYIIYIRFCSTNFITVNFNKLASHWAKVNSSIHPSSTAVIIIRCCNRTMRSRRESEKVRGGRKYASKQLKSHKEPHQKTRGVALLLYCGCADDRMVDVTWTKSAGVCANDLRMNERSLNCSLSRCFIFKKKADLKTHT